MSRTAMARLRRIEHMHGTGSLPAYEDVLSAERRLECAPNGYTEQDRACDVRIIRLWCKAAEDAGLA